VRREERFIGFGDLMRGSVGGKGCRRRKGLFGLFDIEGGFFCGSFGGRGRRRDGRF
jgi:hypothetical protein